MRSRRMGMAATAAGFALILAGCGGDTDEGAKQQQNPASSGTASGPTSSAKQQAPKAGQAGVQWVDGFCGSISEFKKAAQSAQPPQSQDPAAIQQAMSKQLGGIMTGAETVVSDMNSMEPSPIKGGDKLVSNAKGMYSQMLTSAEKAKSQVDSAASSDKQAVMQAVQSASSEFKKVQQAKNPFQVLQGNKKLAGAFQQAPECKQLMKAAQQQQQQQQRQQQQQQQQPGAGGPPAPGPGN